ncbi:hypothetical protein Fleli_3068 [Bernardetia litoralis DSM 6794]|uniref:DUF3037 domain-containing protein n=1 Tax=Bernardetia litoralis (strain ATCC 23117 / DSM 6794 / NBRC 15988 / NCIMB 1366 / Fx l1 / Sio-4) TaxID=880071 RepID=I4AN73_BERLS|nr:hypothetical protein [Bernardetia litoralis]AFM05408.1 hypothetical protein Fleli_3068 [Bernardetia litoralis DSM 6794]
MNNFFTYSLLKYRYSAVLGEVFNIGLLVHFPNQEIAFLYPNKLNRLKGIYPNFLENNIKNTLQNIDRFVTEHGFYLKDFPFHSIFSEIIVSDDSALFFDDCSTSLLYINDREKIKQQLYKKYFFPYEEYKSNSIKRITEREVIKNVKESIKNTNPLVYERYFKNLEKKEISNSATSMSIDLYWKNGATHLIKPISFDLLKAESIDNKANRFFGKFIQFQEQAEKESYIFDVFVTKPKRGALYKQYDKALQILEKAPIQLMEEEEIESYVGNTVEYISNVI